MDYFNPKLEFRLEPNLALIYEGLKMYDDARQIYTDIKEKYYPPGIMFQRVKVKVGNLYYIKGDCNKAIIEWKIKK